MIPMNIRFCFLSISRFTRSPVLHGIPSMHVLGMLGTSGRLESTRSSTCPCPRPRCGNHLGVLRGAPCFFEI